MTDRASTKIAGPRSVIFVACSTLLVTGAAGCATSGSKAGPDRPATVLRLATPEQRGAPYTDDVEVFANRVAELSDGTLRVQVDYEVIPWTQRSEQTITQMVQNGEIELALVPTRVLDTVGIEGFQALQTPMLIDTPELAAAVARSDVADDMLADLPGHDLIGLGLVFEGLRRPLALNGAITRATDLDGLQVRVPRSRLSDLVFTALGAVPDHGDDLVIATTGDRYAVVETELALADSGFPHGSTVTHNLVLFPKYGALLANPDAYEELSDDEREVLRQAADETVARAGQTTADEEDLATTYCETAGDLVAASDTELRAMHDRLQPVVDELHRDPATATRIEAIRELAETIQAPEFTPPPACHPPTGDAARLPSAPAAPTP